MLIELARFPSLLSLESGVKLTAPHKLIVILLLLFAQSSLVAQERLIALRGRVVDANIIASLTRGMLAVFFGSSGRSAALFSCLTGATKYAYLTTHVWTFASAKRFSSSAGN
jgi:hypothetical protein